MRRKRSYAEITMKSGAVVTFDCVSLSWEQKKNLLGEVTSASLKWELADDSRRRPVHFDLAEVVAAVFVDGKR